MSTIRLIVSVMLIFSWIIVYVITLLGNTTIDMISINSFFIFMVIMINTLTPQMDILTDVMKEGASGGGGGGASGGTGTGGGTGGGTE